MDKIWYILGFVLLIVIGISVYNIWFRKTEKEGFQTGAQNYVYLLNNPSDQNGLLTRQQANDVCVLLGGRLAKYSELKGLNFPSVRIQEAAPPAAVPVGLFVYDTYVPYSTFNGGSVPFAWYWFNGSIPHNLFRNYPMPYRGMFQYTDAATEHAITGLPYCYGPYIAPQIAVITPSIETITIDTITTVRNIIVRYDINTAYGTNPTAPSPPPIITGVMTTINIIPTVKKCSDNSTPILKGDLWVCNKTVQDYPQDSCTGVYTETRHVCHASPELITSLAATTVGFVADVAGVNGVANAASMVNTGAQITAMQEGQGYFGMYRCYNRESYGTCIAGIPVDTVQYSQSSSTQTALNGIQTTIFPVLPTVTGTTTLTGSTAGSNGNKFYGRGTGSYQILDLNAVYTQFQIAQNEFPIRRDLIKTAEQARINAINPNIFNSFIYDLNPALTADLSAGRLNGGYTALRYSVPDFNKQYDSTSNVLAHMIWNYTPGISLAAAANPNNQGVGQITQQQYSNSLILEIQNYYDTLLGTFRAHPFAFILKGVASYPSLLNSLPVFNIPKPGDWIPQIAGCNFEISNRTWKYTTSDMKFGATDSPAPIIGSVISNEGITQIDHFHEHAGDSMWGWPKGVDFYFGYQ